MTNQTPAADLVARAEALLRCVNVGLTEKEVIRDLLAALAQAQQARDRSNDAAEALVKVEGLYRANEQEALRRLSLALTGGNAGTWDEIHHAAEQAETECAALRAELDLRKRADAAEQDKWTLAQAIIDERDALRTAAEDARTALRAVVERYGPWHDDECPCDDTCNCSAKPLHDAVNATLAAVPPTP